MEKHLYSKVVALTLTACMLSGQPTAQAEVSEPRPHRVLLPLTVRPHRPISPERDLCNPRPPWGDGVWRLNPPVVHLTFDEAAAQMPSYRPQGLTVTKADAANTVNTLIITQGLGFESLRAKEYAAQIAASVYGKYGFIFTFAQSDEPDILEYDENGAPKNLSDPLRIEILAKANAALPPDTDPLVNIVIIEKTPASGRAESNRTAFVGLTAGIDPDDPEEYFVFVLTHELGHLLGELDDGRILSQYSPHALPTSARTLGDEGSPYVSDENIWKYDALKGVPSVPLPGATCDGMGISVYDSIDATGFPNDPAGVMNSIYAHANYDTIRRLRTDTSNPFFTPADKALLVAKGQIDAVAVKSGKLNQFNRMADQPSIKPEHEYFGRPPPRSRAYRHPAK